MVSRQTQCRMRSHAVVRWLHIESNNEDLVCPLPQVKATAKTIHLSLNNDRLVDMTVIAIVRLTAIRKSLNIQKQHVMMAGMMPMVGVTVKVTIWKS